MAANVDSPRRRSVRLHRRSEEAADPRSPVRAPTSPRSSDSRLSGGGGSVNRTQRKSERQNVKWVGAPQPAEERTQRSGKPRRSREGPPDDNGRVPSTVIRERSDVDEAGSSQKSEERGYGSAGRTKDGACDVRAMSTASRTSDGERVGPSVEGTRADAVLAGPSGTCRVASSESAGGPSTHSTTLNNQKLNPSVSPSRRPPCSPIRATDGSTPPRDSKVQCTSKELLREVLGVCTEFSKQILGGQKDLQPEQHNFIWNFETAFQDNVSINGQSWHEAPDTASEPDLRVLEEQLDDAIVETVMKRKRHPRKILEHFVKGLKTEREILNRYKPVVQPKELKPESSSESRMTEQTAMMAAISQQIKETMKALPAQLEKAEGFSQVLSIQPLLQGSHIRQDIFSNPVATRASVKTVPKELETTPGDNEPASSITPVRSLRRRPTPSLHNDLYPLRSKRKISLEG